MNNLSRRAALRGLTALLAPAVASGAYAAEDWPSRPIRLVVPFAPGGPTDLMARIVAKEMQASLGQAVVVDNKPGGGGVIGLGEVVRAPADGYTLVFPSILAVTNPSLMKDYPFDMARQFSGVTIVGYIPHVLVVNAGFGARTLADLVAMAREKPGSLSYGSSGIGTSAHLEGAMFARMAGIQMTHVPYRGAGPALQDLLGGQIQLMFLDAPSALGAIKAGKLRALAVATAKRAPVLPDVPTVAEQGFPDFDVQGWYGLLVRAGTPAPVLDRLYREVKKALDTPSVADRFRAEGIVVGGLPPAKFDEVIRADLARWHKTVSELGITPQ
ncbi:Bug family tripartite tricarboxylate transporter substrate binding protein [Ramlibacter sp. MMS24-I3-19]|uniref:Bug family tripartite tricarboxylate transporter substrate binding protein n=1 Tax=Ramlibacter sp. MMS24-I3-19 TaxID=3416606 RepID=UPI003D020C7E